MYSVSVIGHRAVVDPDMCSKGGGGEVKIGLFLLRKRVGVKVGLYFIEGLRNFFLTLWPYSY